jgi:L-2-hydroxyglutarate oxidase LhgO
MILIALQIESKLTIADRDSTIARPAPAQHRSWTIMTEFVDTVVIGAGIVGLALARQLALEGRHVFVLEKNAHIGEETSSRNSEVIHAGIYYPSGSLKASLCLAGKQLLYAYCESKGIAYRRCGKLIVAIDQAQEAQLEELQRRALSNGVDDLAWQSAPQIKSLEPQVKAVAGLLSPSTGIVDSHALMLSLQADLEQAGGTVAVRSEFRSGEADRDGFRLRVSTGAETLELKARTVINAAGLHARRVAQAITGVAGPELPQLRFAKGNYFIYSGASPFNRLVYPLPQEGGLGIHATLDLAGRVRFGPDVEWVDDIDYSQDPTRADSFYTAIRSYWPDVAADRLLPGYVGIRPKLHGPGEPAADFAIIGPLTTGGAQLLHLMGIESPGLTASLALAEHVAALLCRT